MKKLFGTDGMRGEAGIFPLDEETIYKVGQSLIRQLKANLGRNPRLVTGRDSRESGEWIEKAFHAGVLAEKGNVESAEVITTPGVAFVTKAFDFDAGIVISASHNPFHDNGIKIFSPSGKKINEETEREIEKDIFESEKSMGNGHETKVDSSRSAEYKAAYLKYLAGAFKNLSLQNLKMVIDCANGASSDLAPTLFESLGAKIVAINCQPTGRNINENCGSLHLENLQTKVLEEKADFGVAFDGDADRALFVDEKGNLVDGDAVLWVMAQHLQEIGKLNDDTVVATVMSNIGLEVALNSKNIKLLRASVGDKYVLEELLNTNTAIGGEQSGHIIFPNKSLVGDGMMTTLFLLEAICEKRKPFSQTIDGFTRFPQVLVNIKVKEKKPFFEIPEIAEHAKQIEVELGTKGRLLLRYSGTEKLARVMIEGENQTEIETQANHLAEYYQEESGVKMLAILYRWRIKIGLEQQFVESWSEITDHYVKSCGSLGSRLHRGNDGLYYAYAQWKSAEDRRAAFQNVPQLMARNKMKETIEESFPEVLLEIQERSLCYLPNLKADCMIKSN